MEHSAGLEQQSCRRKEKAAAGLSLWGFALALLIAACVSPIKNADAPSTESYIVQRGDTLYSIAFRNELDYRQLATWNSIRPPYRIHPGQSLSLRIPIRRVSSPPPPAHSTATASVTVKSGDSLRMIAQRFGISTLDLAHMNHLIFPYRIYPGHRLSIPPRPSQAASAPIPIPKAIAVTPDITNNPPSWVWPVSGKIVSSYDPDSTGKGIGIAGHIGQPILAACNGTVVYSGDGLIGYGRLIIIQHANGYLSAYGHNRSLLVKEGQKVTAGQTIAEMGDTGNAHPLLHFEIRHDGKPVNPLQYLPSIQPANHS